MKLIFAGQPFIRFNLGLGVFALCADFSAAIITSNRTTTGLTKSHEHTATGDSDSGTIKSRCGL